ncbi:MAG TPA: hypothetical protein VEI99_02765 [Terriglobales bacterium]|nr:hypothetical protein [Terriglobales bacterium]
MKIKSVLRIAAVVSIVLLFGAVSARAQEKELITVRNVEVNNGVVLITAQGEKTPIELQCNKDFLGCTVLKPGGYLMVRLPKNHGPYECSNVTVYEKGQNPDTLGTQVGSYCIAEK